MIKFCHGTISQLRTKPEHSFTVESRPHVSRRKLRTFLDQRHTPLRVVCREEWIYRPHSHTLRADNVIAKLDMTEFKSSDDDAGGETPYDPRSLLGIIFYGFSRSIFSSRKLSRACEDNISFMFISGHVQPEHSTICRFIKNHRVAIGKIFAQVLYIAEKMNYVDYRMIAIDGTKIKANASKEFSGTIPDFEKREQSLIKKIEQVLKKHEEAETAEERTYWKEKKERHQKSLDKITAFLKDAKPVTNVDGKERQQNITDKDARIIKGI